MQLKDVTPIISAILRERDNIPLTIKSERYLSGWEANRDGNAMRGGLRKALRLIEQAPAVDAVPVRHGRWVKRTGMMPPEYHGRHSCSICGYFALYARPGVEELAEYCPSCGAKMDVCD